MKPPDFLHELTSAFNRLTGTGPNRHNNRGESVLYREVRAGNRLEVRALLRGGANPNAQTPAGITPLHEAAYWGEREIAALLLKYKADPTITDQHGWTAMHAAAVSGGMRSRSAIITLLKAQGCKDDVPDKHGWTASDYMKLWEENPAAAEKLRLQLTGRQKVEMPPGPPKPRK